MAGSMRWWVAGGLALAACNPETEFRRILSPPEVAIVVPDDEQALRIGEDEGTFSGTVSDGFDLPEGLSATWYLDDAATEVPVTADDTVTLQVDFTTLELGPHTLRLVAIDSDGLEAEDAIDWTLQGAFAPPTVIITAPVPGVTVARGEEITFRGEATDNNTAPNDLVFAWSSSVDGALDGAISGEGQSVLFDSSLTDGVHTITLEATDVDGLTGSDAVEVTVSRDVGPPVDAEVGDVVFSEIMVRPLAVEDVVGEWVELYTTSGNPIDLSGYVFSDLDIDRYVIAGPLVVAPDDFVVLCADTNLANNGGIPCDAGYVRTESGGNGAMAFGNN
ncbi:MAG: lamin tail domain-containing protein, partial [Myxococcota bacterium]